MDRTDKIVPVILVRNDAYWLPFCLKAVKGLFSRFVIYDIGSEDGTREILEQFISSEAKDECDFFYRTLPFCEPLIQGIFRNSMIAESQAEWNLILDADEVYPRDSLIKMIRFMDTMNDEYVDNDKVYGLVRRLEVSHDLTQIHGMNEKIPHHRIYHRFAIWKGTHPGEEAIVPQNSKTELWYPDDVYQYHFHQPDRSPHDNEVPRRVSRRFKSTYMRGEATKVDILKEIPLLQKPVGHFEVSPRLKELQDEWKP